ncbi:MAG: hypothetical protein JO055_00535 [Alphaproteobacteria bacterium]|nr:hypothetical protein [Alphaproteobacteria bacterium]
MRTPNESWEVVFKRELAVARGADDIEGAQRLVMRQWWRIVGELDRIDRRWVNAPHQARAEEARQFERSLVRQDMRRIIERIVQWPAAALGLLEHRDLKQWRPLLIGRLAAHPQHRRAMIERAFKVRKVRRGRFEIAQEFIAIARADRDLGLLETTELLLQDLPDGIAPVLDALIAAYGALGVADRAMALALEAILAGHAQPFIELLQAGHVVSVPPEFIDALAGYKGHIEHVLMIAELRQAGHTAAAAQLAERLTDPIDRLRSELDRAARLLHTDSPDALDIADVAVHLVLDSGRLPPRFDHELCGFLRLVPLTSMTVERVLDLAGLIIARPMREEIAANVACSLVLAGDAGRARRLLASMVNETQRRRVLTLLGDGPS